MKKKLAIVATTLSLLAALVGCGKEIDKGAVGAVKVPGTYNLWWFCDTSGGASTLIYFEDNSSGDDEYVLIWPGACTTDGKQKPMQDNSGQNANEPGDN